jgi:hypothetical protein
MIYRGMVLEKAPDEIMTFSGVRIKPLDPNPWLISIVDVAHALSNQCRFTGHTKQFYSVAEHSVRVSKLVPEEDAMWGLLHDASEAYLSDISRPIKQQPGLGEVYRVAEAALQRAVAYKFNLPLEVPPSVKVADNVLLRSEQRDLMPDGLRLEGYEYLDHKIEPWTPEQAKGWFLLRYYQILDDEQGY